MRAWTRPEVPKLAGRGPVPRLADTARGAVVATEPNALAALYVCGITPYDATHIGHASTYLAYDTLIRLWLDAGYDVSYVQNVTDVDDPLLQRAIATGVDWRVLAADQTDLFRQDMQALGVIPPDHFVAVTEMIEPIARAVARLVSIGVGYRVDGDIYFDSRAAAAASQWHLGQVSGYSRETMIDLFSERGGDPEREGKRDPLDPLLWRARRENEPWWTTVVGEGRPGWHIECSVIASEYLDLPITVNGGGVDLVFPHHEFTAGHTAALTGAAHAHLWSHTSLVSYRGAKMSKSLGNLVFVSSLLAAGDDPRAIRLAILAHHYRVDWEWTQSSVVDARRRLDEWRAWARDVSGPNGPLVDELRSILSRDLDTPSAIAAIDDRVASGAVPAQDEIAAIHALLGVNLLAV